MTAAPILTTDTGVALMGVYVANRRKLTDTWVAVWRFDAAHLIHENLAGVHADRYTAIAYAAANAPTTW